MKTIEQLAAAAKAQADKKGTTAPAAPEVKAGAASAPEGEKRPTALEIVGSNVVVPEAMVEALTVAGLKIEKQEDGAQVISGLVVPQAAESESVTALSSQIGTQAVELASLRAENQQLTSDLVSMVGFASDSLNTMNVALGSGAVDVSKMNVSQLLSVHTQTAASFKAKFPVGGVAAINVDNTTEAQVAAQSDLTDHLARIRATGNRKFNQGA